MTEEQLSALLRTVKRHEQPPPGYLDDIMRGVHRRQREDILQPLWKIAWERCQTLFSHHSMSPLAYGGAMASLVVIGVVGIGFMTTQGPTRNGGSVAVANPALPKVSQAQVAPASASGQAFGQAPLPAQSVTHKRVETKFVIDGPPVGTDRPPLSL